jgi:hypothetical protein
MLQIRLVRRQHFWWFYGFYPWRPLEVNSPKNIIFFSLISNSISLESAEGTTHVHRTYTGKIPIREKMKNNSSKFTIIHRYPCMKGFEHHGS